VSLRKRTTINSWLASRLDMASIHGGKDPLRSLLSRYKLDKLDRAERLVAPKSQPVSVPTYCIGVDRFKKKRLFNPARQTRNSLN